LAAGLVTRAQLYGPRYRRVYPNVYLPAGLELDLATRSRAAYLLVQDRGGVLAGYSAAVALGADCAPPDAPAEVLVATNTRAHPGLRICRGTATGPDVVTVHGMRVTAPLRTAWDLARRLPLVEAVVAVDALAHTGSFAPADLLARRAGAPGARGSRRLAEVVALAEPRAQSPAETRLRLGLLRAGLPPPAVQYRVCDEHGFGLARVDLAYPEARLAIEYDGADELGADELGADELGADELGTDGFSADEFGADEFARRVARDRMRDGELAGHGWQTLRLGADDIGIDLPRTARRVERLLALRG
jgi:very-short-patch-repair endonuclease